MGITSSRAISLPAIIAGLGGGNAVGTNAVATGATLTNSLSTGTAANPNFVIQVGVATVSGAAQATATTTLTIVGETLAANFAGSVGLVSAATLAWNSDAIIARAGAANLRLGAVAVDTAPVAQTLSVQNTLAGGTSNVAGANFTIAGSQGKGTGVGGSLIFQTAPAGSTGTTVNALATALTIDSTGAGTFTGGLRGAGILSTGGGNIGWLGATTLAGAGTDGILVIKNSGNTTGFSIDGTTDATAKFRNRGNSAAAFVNGQIQTSVNATTGLAAGVLAATTNATLVVYDASGQAYRVPAII